MNQNTKFVAIGCASNLLGTVNDFKTAQELCSEYGAKLILDAVHYAPHFPINVVEIGCDFLFCSAYKFYGPHVGILYSKPGELDALPTDSLRTQYQKAPYKIETGTLNHAALAGVSECIRFMASTFGDEEDISIHAAMEALSKHEYLLLEQLYNGINEIPKATIYGPGLDSPRTPTVSFTYEGLNPEEVCTILGKKGIYAWDGHFYAIRPIEVLGLLDRGGVTRLGISIYTTPEDIERTVKAISMI
jgi:selenocysteine lyase/cysteine desulfurase